MRVRIGIQARTVLLIFCAGVLAYGAAAQTGTQDVPFRGLPLRDDLGKLSIERRAEDLLKEMTVEEKVGQLVQYSIGTPTGPGTGRSGYEEMIGRGEVGSLFNLDGVKSINHLQHIAVEKSRLHIPILFGLDVIHGYRTIFPMPLAMASSWDPPLVE